MGSKSNGGAVDFTQGIGGMANGGKPGGFNFSAPDDSATAGGPQPMAGLTGVASGMGGDYTAGNMDGISSGPSEYQFTTTGGYSPDINKLGASLGMGAALADPTGGQGGQRMMTNSAGRHLQAQQFMTGLAPTLGASGSQAGNGLLQLLQKYQVGR